LPDARISWFIMLMFRIAEAAAVAAAVAQPQSAVHAQAYTPRSFGFVGGPMYPWA